MAVPSTGSVSMRGIRREIGNNNYSSSTDYTNISLEDMSKGVNGTINTSSTSRPNGTNPHKMSEFRGYGHDASALTLMTTITGQQHSSSSSTRTTFSYNANAFKGKTIRVLFHYQSGSSYRGDFQIDNIKLPYTSTQYYSNAIFWTQHNVTFQNTSYGYDGAVFYPPWGEEDIYFAHIGNMQTTRADTTSYTTATWYDIIAGASNLRWNGRSGGTPSSSTGLTRMSGYYAYAEVSGAFNKNFWMRTPEWYIPNEVGSANIGFDYGAYGSNMGTLKAYIQEI